MIFKFLFTFLIYYLFGFDSSALDNSNGNKVAIKKVHPMAKDLTDAKHTLREIRIIRHLCCHPNVNF